MRRRNGLWTAFAVLTVFATIAVAEETEGPHILIEEMRHDLGEIFEADTYSHTFSVKNTGTADLLIEKVHPSCGCTVAKFDEVIPPGGEGTIHLDIEGEKVKDRWNKTATVYTNDPNRPRVTISLGGTILQHVTVEPSARIYLRGLYGESVEKEVTIFSREKQTEFEVLDVTSDIDDKITYRVIPEAEPGYYKVLIFKNPKLPTMNQWGSLKIQTNSELSPEKVVQVNVTTRGSIVAQPSTLNFGSIAADESKVEKTITIFKVKGEFDIENVEFSSDRYRANVEPLEDGKKYLVTVAFSPSDDTDSYLDEMIIRTNDPAEPSVRVRLLARKI